MFRARGENATRGGAGWILVGVVEELGVRVLLKIVRHGTYLPLTVRERSGSATGLRQRNLATPRLPLPEYSSASRSLSSVNVIHLKNNTLICEDRVP
jgi:hypothetical protein